MAKYYGSSVIRNKVVCSVFFVILEKTGWDGDIECHTINYHKENIVHY